jgi:hypothetical protein
VTKHDCKGSASGVIEARSISHCSNATEVQTMSYSLRRVLTVVVPLALSTLVAVPVIMSTPASAIPKPCPTCGSDPGDTPPTTRPPRPHRPGNVNALMVSMGDSYASGEGSPDAGPQWLSPACHRSSTAAPALAANTLRSMNHYAETIDSLSVACSGAALTDGITTPQSGTGLTSQISQVNAAIGTRPIDALTISIGGNDLHFASVVMGCTDPTTDCSTDPSVNAGVTADLAALPGKFTSFVKAVQGDGTTAPLLAAPVKDVFVTLYPNPTTDDNGFECGSAAGLVALFRFGVVEPFMLILQSEAVWAVTTLINPLNTALTAAVAAANSAASTGAHPTWHVVTPPNYFGHGYCSNTPWVNTVTASFASQGDQRGAMHPNTTGQFVSSGVITSALSYLT